VRFLLVCGLDAYLNYLQISRARSPLCFILVGMRGVMPEGGEGGCGLGRRIW